MSGFSYEAPNLGSLKERVRTWGQAKEHEAIDLLELTILEGVEVTRANLLAAHTRTGLARAEFSGGLPGRYVTGTMYDAIADDVDTAQFEGSRLYMAFGWFPSNWEEYFGEQEDGVGNIPAANALPPAEITAISQLKGRLAHWATTSAEF